jgi:hypothetical protein
VFIGVHQWFKNHLPAREPSFPFQNLRFYTIDASLNTVSLHAFARKWLEKSSDPPSSWGVWPSRVPSVDVGENSAKIYSMNLTLPLKEMTIAEKIGVMEEIWCDLSNSGMSYSPPAWHDRILEERARLANSGEVGFTDWEAAKKQISDLVS